MAMSQPVAYHKTEVKRHPARKEKRKANKKASAPVEMPEDQGPTS